MFLTTAFNLAVNEGTEHLLRDGILLFQQFGLECLYSWMSGADLIFQDGPNEVVQRSKTIWRKTIWWDKFGGKPIWRENK